MLPGAILPGLRWNPGVLELLSVTRGSLVSVIKSKCTLHFNARQLLSSRRARLRWRCCGAELGQEHLNFSICPWSCFLFFPALSPMLSCSLGYSSWILTSPPPAGEGGKERSVREQERLVLCWKPPMVPPAPPEVESRLSLMGTLRHFMSFPGASHSQGIVLGKHLLWSILTVPH